MRQAVWRLTEELFQFAANKQSTLLHIYPACFGSFRSAFAAQSVTHISASSQMTTSTEGHRRHHQRHAPIQTPRRTDIRFVKVACVFPRCVSHRYRYLCVGGCLLRGSLPSVLEHSLSQNSLIPSPSSCPSRMLRSEVARYYSTGSSSGPGNQ